MDACVQALEWTLDEKTTRIEKNTSISKEMDIPIFIPAKCEAQEVKLTYIFRDDSLFRIDDDELKLTVQAFTEKCLQMVGEGQSVDSKTVIAL